MSAFSGVCSSAGSGSDASILGEIEYTLTC
jgi:hypothetical protein